MPAPLASSNMLTTLRTVSRRQFGGRRRSSQDDSTTAGTPNSVSCSANRLNCPVATTTTIRIRLMVVSTASKVARSVGHGEPSL